MNVLFLCKGNSCRSQMAEGFARRYLKGANVFSAGSKPEGFVHPKAIEVMAEVGIDISGQRSKGVRELPPVEWDVVITLCSGRGCPSVPGKYHEVWDVPDPYGGDLRTYRKNRDEIDCHVRRLARRLYRMRFSL